MKGKNLVGQRFGKLIVAEDSGQRHRDCILWRCTCDCVNEVLALGLHLTRGITTSCGCVPKPRRPIEDLTGQTFGKLTVLKSSGTRNDDSLWLCRCDCGNLHEVTSGNLKNGSTLSCGCLTKRIRSERGHLNYVSGTQLEGLARHTPKNNTSGYIGVAKGKKEDTYRAQIKFRGKNYHFGEFNSPEKAYQARLEAEKIIHIGFKDAYDKWKKHEAADPERALVHPFMFEVSKVNGEFQIITNGNQ